MLVRKFEANTIKSAIDMVKLELGPDAIILSAKENSRGFGLGGKNSVVVTAAISEMQLRQKQLAEKKLNTKGRDKYTRSSAKSQKSFIEKALRSHGVIVDDFVEGDEALVEQDAGAKSQRVLSPKVQARPVTSIPYISITEDEQSHEGVEAPHPGIEREVNLESSTHGPEPQAPELRAQKMTSPKPLVKLIQKAGAANVILDESENVVHLKNEISHLKGLLERFQSVPQTFVSRHPGADEGISYELSEAYSKLTAAGVSASNVARILQKADQTLNREYKAKRSFVDGWLIKYLLDEIEVVKKPCEQRLHVFLGATGQGKTSTVVKFASHLVLKERKKVAILTGDSVKLGAADQLRTYCKILNIPFAVISQAKDWLLVLNDLRSADYILFDTPGVNLRGTQELDLLKNILPPADAHTKYHYVQSVVARDADAFEVAQRFQILGFNDVIFTKLDECVQHGLIYNFQKKFDVPLHSFGIGPRMPEDYEFATKERVVDLLFNLSNFKKERGQS